MGTSGTMISCTTLALNGAGSVLIASGLLFASILRASFQRLSSSATEPLTNATDAFLHSHATGLDSNYWLPHKWSGEAPSESALQQWTDYFQSASICNTR
jgi:hypothetical protein